MDIERERFERLLTVALEHAEVKPYIADRRIDAFRLRRRLLAMNAKIGESRSSLLLEEKAIAQQIGGLQQRLESARAAAAATAIDLWSARLPAAIVSTALARRVEDAARTSPERQLLANIVRPLIIEKLPTPRTGFFPPRLETVLGLSGGFFGLGLVMSIGLWLYAAFAHTESVGIWLKQSNFAIGTFMVTGLAFVALIVFGVMGNIIAGRYERRAVAATGDIVDAVLNAGAAFERELTATREMLQKQTEATDRSLLEAMIEQVRDAIAVQIGSSYSQELGDLIASGLAEGTQEAQYQIPTAAFQEVERQLETMPSGSIGIAGQRGAGKSTLLQAIGRKTTIRRPVAGTDEMADTPVISIAASAPVQYDAREFILHLFSLLCTRVRVLGGDVQDLEEPNDAPPADEYVWWAPLLRRYAAYASLICFAIAFVIAAMVSVKTLWSASALAKVIGDVKVLDSLLQCTLFSLAGFVLRTVAREYDRHLHERWRKGQDRPSGESFPAQPEWFKAQEAEWKHLVATARKQLLRIRYQRNYSLDAQVGAKLAALEVGLKRGMSWSEQRLTLPEVVEEYRAFVRLVAAHAVVIVTIDEIDKISSDEQAQRFVNDIKAVFNIPNCFYLITVSDNAMANFARRGLPIRDAFDSAFDEIIRVEYLDLAAAEELLRKRIIGLPLPFVAFCYCFAGGLPRDLIRACRSLFEHKHLTNSAALQAIAESVVRDDLLAKLHASIQTINQNHDGNSPVEAGIVGRLWSSMETVRNAGDLVAEYDALTKMVTISTEPADKAESDRVKKVRSLVLDVASYLYYCRMLLELIGKTSGAGQWTARRPVFDEAARLRRYIGVESLGAAVKIKQLRDAHAV